MAWRFRKSVSLAKGIRLNIGKSGLGLSAGIKGARIGVGSRGVYTSMGIPGTGLYSVNYSGKNIKSPSTADASLLSAGCMVLILVFLQFILFVFFPIIGVGLFFITIIFYYFWSKQPKQLARKKLTKARNLFNQKNYSEAIVLLREANALDTKNSNIIYLLGGALHNSEKYDEALKYFEEYLSMQPNADDVKLFYANCLYQTKQYQEAIDVLQKLFNDSEPNVKVIQLIGICFAAQKKFDLAIEVLKKAPLQKRNLDDELMELHYNLANIYEESGDKKNALKHFKKIYAENINYRDVSERIETLSK